MVSVKSLIAQLYKITGPVLTLAYPLYQSIVAIESFNKEDETQWLTYWVLYSLIQLVEISLDKVLVWIPIWYPVKLALVAWLTLPQFHGAAWLYENYVKKQILGASAGKNEKLTLQQRDYIDQMSPDARASVSAFITQYGSSAFDQLMNTVAEQARKNKAQ